MAELLARALAKRNPDMRTAGRLQGQKIIVLINLESELSVEIFRDREIGNSEMKTVDRMNAEFTRTSGRLDGAANGGHGASSVPSRTAAIRPIARGLSMNAPAGWADWPRSARARVAKGRLIGRRLERRCGRRIGRGGRNDGWRRLRLLLFCRSRRGRSLLGGGRIGSRIGRRTFVRGRRPR